MRVLLLNQCFHPDVMATAQYLTDVAVELAERGHRVTVLASRSGYDDPTQRFSARESWRGIDIVRISSLGLGKANKYLRLVDFGTYLITCFVRLMFLPRQDLTVALTSPPLISFFGAMFVKLRGGRFCFWVMDLNPDEGIELGWVREDSLVARTLQKLLKYSFRHSDQVIALDRFMRQRIVSKGIPAERISVVPPWSHDGDIRYDEVGRAAFRKRHELTDKFVVMYSGNHSACHPLDTLLNAALILRSDGNTVFCFVGGGSEFRTVKEFAQSHSLSNILCLPYQPRAELSGSLSSADLHVVIMGDRFRGLVHPCKVYNIIALGVPFLYIGPEESHVTDLLARGVSARAARHGDVEEVVAHIRAAASAPGRIPASQNVSSAFSSYALLSRMISLLEQVVGTGTALAARSESFDDQDSLSLGGSEDCEIERFGGQIPGREIEGS
jgi:glycosyltransferase involved in cell wall biosynthesis